MAEESGGWRYRVSSLQFYETDEKGQDRVNENLEKWADAGWELVSGTATAFTVHSVATPLIRYVMYWKKRKA
jgi:hypothetical protein